MNKLNKYSTYVKVFVFGESEEDALDSLNAAVDSCDLLDQDGVIGIEVLDDVEDLTGYDDDDED